MYMVSIKSIIINNSQVILSIAYLQSKVKTRNFITSLLHKTFNSPLWNVHYTKLWSKEDDSETPMSSMWGLWNIDD